VVAEWATRRRKEEAASSGGTRPRKIPSARGIARMMTSERDTLSKTVARTIAWSAPLGVDRIKRLL